MKNVNIPESYIKQAVGPACEWDKDIIDAFLSTPRHRFLDEAMLKMAYRDDALPIGYGQTISKPSTVAYMTKKLEVSEEHTVLEIGSGSGFQAAILSKLCKTVYTVERVPELHRRAYQIIKRIPLRNVKMKLEPFKLGWSEFGPYDRIIATAEGKSVPDELVAQLADGGLMLVPADGKLMRVTRNGNDIQAKPLANCSFVDFVGA
ncbi:Protein-L-isoaspartate(D-aspartate)O-methyltrans ferase [Denitrovibrio acetiphilus DSM 12809]|uniref:Protein-L-isoaspartate O-methyltransferase n=1 Tax=Denitrovibrio acetiphilus (strain DSM 12809 / NBRC 114555 / N2460) TaxID=522772 RepID=D4H3F9_DENA2|nr:protein-L-isoaspartate(D-aspartate) O-methyltransferase [Denitrovibrio acetiphilus]ADD67243.1 Protein-L-isoaspartate(D-aspartate)O-methyltrans ferase [Denitrovibrio acetiphilus DSM 12809]